MQYCHTFVAIFAQSRRQRSSRPFNYMKTESKSVSAFCRDPSQSNRPTISQRNFC